MTDTSKTVICLDLASVIYGVDIDNVCNIEDFLKIFKFYENLLLIYHFTDFIYRRQQSNILA